MAPPAAARVLHLRQRRRSARLRRAPHLSWPLLIVEVVAIVLGVALGSLANEWRQDRADRALGEAALRSIAAEMSQNCAQIRGVAPYYARMTAALDSVAAADGIARMGRVPGFQGLNPPLLRTGSYDVALATGALSNVPFETADLASGVYSAQTYVTRAVEYALQGLVQGTVGDEGGDLRGVRMPLALLSELTGGMSRFYDRLADSPFAEHGFHCPPAAE